MIKKVSACIFILLLFSFSSILDFKNLVLNKLKSYVDNYPEKVYVKTDKPYYTQGEDIWFTAYLLNGINHQRTNKSNVLHVELINDKDSILSQKLLYTDDISVAGDFKIGNDWKEGNYVLRAYTNYMRNQNKEFIYKREIPIWKLKKNDSLSSTSSIEKSKKRQDTNQESIIPKLSFYPEGGYMVNGIPSKIAVRAMDQFNNDIEIKGLIKDSEENIISVFQTLKFGLGFTTITPKPNTNYYASIKINNQEVTYPIPNALRQGYNLSLINNGEEINIVVTANTPFGLQNSFLVGHQRGKVIYEKFETSSTDKYALKLITSSLQDGVASFTLFDNNGKPVCERLIFIDNPLNTVTTTVKNNNTFYKTRDKVVLNIDVKNNNNDLLASNLSVSITDFEVVENSSFQNNIKTYLLLNSDLKGTIKNPEYFFEKEDDSKRQFLLDLVMLTNGWRRFTWNGLLNNNSSNELLYKPEKGISFFGHTTALNKTQTKVSAATRFTLWGNPSIQEQKKSNKDGEFSFGPYVLFDSVPGFIEARLHGFKSVQKNNREVSIFMDNKYYYSPRIDKNGLLKSISNDSLKKMDFIQQSKTIIDIDSSYLKSNLLEEVIVTARKQSEREKREEILDSRTDYGFPTNRLDIQKLPNSESHNLYQLLNRIPSVRVLNDSVKIRNGRNAKVLLDGNLVELTDISHLTGNEIDFIDILTGADASFYSNAGNGIVAVYSRRGVRVSTSNVKRKPGIIDFTSVGFYSAREFYAPDHINGITETLKQDIRSTLHWEPKIVLDGNNKGEISFFTCDKKSRYGITIEGMTHSGIPIYHFSTFVVE